MNIVYNMDCMEGMRMANVYKFIPFDLYQDNKNKEKPVVGIKDERIWRFPSVRDAARLMNIPSPNIVACLKGRLKTAGGFRWKYADDFCSYGERKGDGNGTTKD